MWYEVWIKSIVFQVCVQECLQDERGKHSEAMKVVLSDTREQIEQYVQEQRQVSIQLIQYSHSLLPMKLQYLHVL